MGAHGRPYPHTVAAFEAALLSEPRFEGPPPPSPAERMHGGRDEAARRRRAAALAARQEGC